MQIRFDISGIKIGPWVLSSLAKHKQNNGQFSFANVKVENEIDPGGKGARGRGGQGGKG